MSLSQTLALAEDFLHELNGISVLLRIGLSPGKIPLTTRHQMAYPLRKHFHD